MCGIALILGPDASAREAELERMLQALEHRGERTGRFSRTGVLAGVRRLPITDPDGSEQPLAVTTDGGDAFILFNGEIFNYGDLRDELSARPGAAPFDSRGDTEVALRVWLDGGPAGLSKLRGQYAFVVVRDNTAFAARDALGIKPLYFARARGCWYIASEIKALTFLKEKISVCEPGQTYEFKAASAEPFARAVPGPLDTSRGESAENSSAHWTGRVRAHLEEAVRMRCATSLPLGVVYSGGIDSSIVLHLAARHHKNVTAFTAGSPGSEDFAVSRRFCEERGIKQVLLSLSPRELGTRVVAEAVRVSELTEYGDIINAAISLPLFRAVRDAGIKVVLTGDGSDELFAGYNMYAANAAAQGDGRLFMYKLMNLHRTELQRVDRCAMAATVEARVPFLDTRVVETALAMPDEFKRRGDVEKWCLREAFRDELPDYVIDRRKNPLSHSSGLHEIVRGRKYMFGGAYRKAGYGLHDSLRMDFSHLLRTVDYDLDRAREALKQARDYSRLQLLTEALKARVRRLISGFRNERTGNRIV